MKMISRACGAKLRFRGKGSAGLSVMWHFHLAIPELLFIVLQHFRPPGPSVLSRVSPEGLHDNSSIFQEIDDSLCLRGCALAWARACMWACADARVRSGGEQSKGMLMSSLCGRSVPYRARAVKFSSLVYTFVLRYPKLASWAVPV